MNFALDDRFALFLTQFDMAARMDPAVARHLEGMRISYAVEEAELAVALLTGLPCDRCAGNPHEILSICISCMTPYVVERVQYRWRLFLLALYVKEGEAI